MYILFFDTETTGLPKNYNAPATNTANWPRLIQLGYIISDYNRNVIKQKSIIIKPDGFTIPEQASNIHGITTEIANNEGIDIRTVLSEFEKDLVNVDLIVGHNVDYDINIVDCESYRYFNRTTLDCYNKICTKLASTDFCALPNNKWPKLEELHLKLFGKIFEGAHDALTDITATAKCFWELVDIDIIRITENDSLKKHIPELNICEELNALGRFYYNLRQTNLSDSIETQLDFLSHFSATIDKNILKTTLSEMQDVFIKKQYSEFINTHEYLFEEAQSYDDKFYKAIALGHLGPLLNFSDKKDYRKSVINKYFSILQKFEFFAYDYIITNSKYEYTVNTKDVFDRYVAINKKHDDFCNSITQTNTCEKTYELVKEFAPIVNQLQLDGLDEYSFECIVSNLFIGKLKAIIFILNDPLFNQAEIEGINDKATVLKAIEAIEILKSEIDISNNDKLKNEIESYSNIIKYNLKSFNSNIGCMLVLPLIISSISCLFLLIKNLFV